MVTGNDYVDDGFHEDLVQCLKNTDASLYQSVNSQWAGIKRYANDGGHSPDDIWHPCDSQDHAKASKHLNVDAIELNLGPGVPRERSHQEHQNEPPHDIAV